MNLTAYMQYCNNIRDKSYKITFNIFVLKHNTNVYT